MKIWSVKLYLWLPAMNKIGLFLAILTLGELAKLPVAYGDDIAMNTARMQAMDKITGHVTEIDVPVNGVANFGSFSILARKCVTHSPEETPEDTAFIDVVDNYESDNPVNIFKGWMFSSTPALSAVEHPIYDVWLLKCYNNTKQDAAMLLNKEQLALRDELPMVRPEKVKVSIGEISDMNDIETKDEDLPTIETDNSSSSEGNALSDDDFASEGEENWEADIIIDSRNDNLAAETNEKNN